MDQQEDANRVESFRNATKSLSKLGNRISPFKLLILMREGFAAFMRPAVI